MKFLAIMALGPFVARPAGSLRVGAPDGDRLLAADLVRPNRAPI